MRVLATASAGVHRAPRPRPPRTMDGAARLGKPMQALTRYRPSAGRLLMRHPALWLVTAAAGAGAGIFAGALGAIAVLGGTVGMACAALRIGRVRGRLERSAYRTWRRARREAREARLDQAGIPQLGLDDATALVDHVTAADPWLAEHLELEPLLDRYVELELAIACYAGLATRRSRSRSGLESSATRPRTRIRDRSTALRRAYEAQLAEARDELASIIELLRLLVQRTALDATAAEVDPEADPIGERLALLDD